jgi:folylpolyglutamate synthase/dihydropteroate synthase
LAREMGRDGTVLVTGSAYTVGEARQVLSVG